MNIKKQELTLEQTPANRRLVEQLFSHGKITNEAPEYALKLLYPHNQWGLWISSFLLTIGVALVLSGVVSFFAFNWVKFTAAVKLSVILFGVIGCLTGAGVYSLQRMNGKLLLLSASVLAGVFMAVFGQVYQTGAASYKLFMMWVLLTLGWTLLSNFAAQWIFWLIITNVFLVLWWQQAVLPFITMHMEIMIFTYTAVLIYTYTGVLNGTAMALREYFLAKHIGDWLEARWIRVVLTIATLFSLLIPVLVWIFVAQGGAKAPIVLSGAIGFIGHGTIYYFYRFKLPDAWSVSAVVLSSCVIVASICLRILIEIFGDSEAVAVYVLFAILAILACATILLRKTIKEMETGHV